MVWYNKTTGYILYIVFVLNYKQTICVKSVLERTRAKKIVTILANALNGSHLKTMIETHYDTEKRLLHWSMNNS